MKHIYFSG